MKSPKSSKTSKPSYGEKKLGKIDVEEKLLQHHEQFLTELKKELPKIKEVLAVILFGSFARGDYSFRHSDIDLMIFLDKEQKDSSLEQKIQQKIITLSVGKGISPHTVFQYKKVEEEDKSLLITIGREGKVVFARSTIVISHNLMGLIPYVLIRFDTTGCPPTTKNKLQRFLYGYTINGKKYKGIVDEEKVLAAGRSALLVPEELQKKVLLFAQSIGVKVGTKGRFYR